MSIENNYAMVSANDSFTSLPLDSAHLLEERAYSTALFRSLKAAGVKFLRFYAIDINNNARCKAIPIDRLLKVGSMVNQVSLPKCCFAGLARHEDDMVEGTGFDAKDSLILKPDLNTLRVLPYNRKSAIVLGTLHDQASGELSPLDCRGRLSKFLAATARKSNIAFSVGSEIEFCLLDKSGQPVDNSLAGQTSTLVEQERFISALYDYLVEQDIEVETIHAESGPGQMEVVLAYQHDPVRLADNVVLARETIRAVAQQHSTKALFLPKYDMHQAGNGLHVHMSLRDATTGKPLLFEPGCPGFSDTGKMFLEGLLTHLPGIACVSIPSSNSYRRLGKGCWTGSVVGWAIEDKDCSLRVCCNLSTQEWDHIEYKVVEYFARLWIRWHFQPSDASPSDCAGSRRRTVPASNQLNRRIECS